LTNYP